MFTTLSLYRCLNKLWFNWFMNSVSSYGLFLNFSRLILWAPLLSITRSIFFVVSEPRMQHTEEAHIRRWYGSTEERGKRNNRREKIRERRKKENIFVLPTWRWWLCVLYLRYHLVRIRHDKRGLWIFEEPYVGHYIPYTHHMESISFQNIERVIRLSSSLSRIKGQINILLHLFHIFKSD